MLMNKNVGSFYRDLWVWEHIGLYKKYAIVKNLCILLLIFQYYHLIKDLSMIRATWESFEIFKFSRKNSCVELKDHSADQAESPFLYKGIWPGKIQLHPCIYTMYYILYTIYYIYYIYAIWPGKIQLHPWVPRRPWWTARSSRLGGCSSSSGSPPRIAWR